MRKLLVPFDNSENAHRALDYAIGLAKDSGRVEITLVTAHEPVLEYARSGAFVSKEEMERHLERQSAEVLGAGIEKLKAAGVSFASAVLTGHVAPAIVQKAEELGCDAIVMGTRGMGAIGTLLLGSVAQKVFHLTRLPVTLVK